MNATPVVSVSVEKRAVIRVVDGKLVNVTAKSVFELIRDIRDPEHPYTIEQLDVVSKSDITIGMIDSDGTVPRAGLPIRCVNVQFRPTIPHCSMAAIIGLCIKAQLSEFIKDHLIQVHVADGAHVNFKALNKQLDDKDRVFAAFENDSLMSTIKECLPTIGTSYSEV